MFNLVSPSIQKIAKNLLPVEKLQEANELVKKSLDKNKEFIVLEHLWTILKYQIPDSGEINGKQLDYATQDLEDLVDLLRLGKKKFGYKTRSLVFALAHSIESLCKAIWREHVKVDGYDFILDDPKRPLGPTLKKLSENKILDKNILKSLYLFNDTVWNENKHDVGLTYSNGRNHLFSVPEVIMITFIVVALTRKLIPFIRFDIDWRCNDWGWKNTSLLIDEMDKDRK